MDPQVLQTLLDAAIRAATEQTKRDFQQKLDDLTSRITLMESPSHVEDFREVTIEPGKICDESLDLVKSLPEFSGDQARYVSWRQAAHTAYKIFEKHDGSSKHYQAVAIIRNKIVGSADTILSSFNTCLNFQAIIARLDFTYADKRPVYLIEQEMSTLRQGGLSIIEFYEEVEKKLTLLINKTIMTHSGQSGLIDSLNSKYRQDALRVFVSGLNRPLCDILFSSRPGDMPTALALAQELEANRARSLFASSFNNRQTLLPLRPTNSLPQFRRSTVGPQRQQIVPMEVDPSMSRFRQNRTLQERSNFLPQRNQPSIPNQEPRGIGPNTPQNNSNVGRTQFADYRERPQKRNYESDRQPVAKLQRINHLVNQRLLDDPYDDYTRDEYYEADHWNNNVGDDLGDSQQRDHVNDTEYKDEINFLDFVTPAYPTSAGDLQERN